jgi:hypothetical protein
MNCSAPVRIIQWGFLMCSFVVCAGSSSGDPSTRGDPSPPLLSLPESAPGDGFVSSIEAFADPRTTWGSGVEAVIEKAYRECLRTYIFEDQILTLRLPFAQNNEREAIAEAKLDIVGGGKANPLIIWDHVDELLASDDFLAYQSILGDGREKVIIFDLADRTWLVSRDFFDVAQMKVGAYQGLPHKPYVFSSGAGLQVTDVYNYLYSVGRIGLDCSGFVWHILASTAAAGGVDLSRELNRLLRAPREADTSRFMGTAFYASKSAQLIQVSDQIQNLQPSDVILFRGSDGDMAHSAIIQSVDFSAGVIRYLQSTDEAPPDERGSHDSYIFFDPAKTGLTLKDESLEWSQRRFPPFVGERSSGFSGDGDRYRAYPELGGGKVVRLRAMATPIDSITQASE